jgi:aryl-alcohol dehydrogenase-like predicted oxidoreductase
MRDPLIIPIPGARNRKQAEDNSAAADWELSNQELNEIDLACSSLNIEYFP